jgi:hypothetical protein
MAASTQWTFQLQDQTIQSLRDFLATAGESDPSAIDRFVDLAIKDRIFDEAVRKAKAATAHLHEDEIMSMVDQALEEVRSGR